MVPRGRRALIGPRYRAVLAGLGAALWIWWNGPAAPSPIPPPISGWLPPLLAGLSAGLAFSLIDGLAGPLAGVLAAVLVLAMPGFLAFHQTGPESAAFLLVTIVMLVTMVHAPRWSLAYGALAAVTAVFLSPAAMGLPIAAAAWAARSHPSNGSSRRGRLLLALTPLLAALILAGWFGEGWPIGDFGWHGDLDRGMRAAGAVIGDQLAPGIESPPVRFFAIADLSLILIAVIVMAWWRIARQLPTDALLHRWYGAAGTLAAALGLGLMARWLLLLDAPDPSLETVFPLAVLGVLAGVVSVTVWWPRWPRSGKAFAVVLLLGWLQAAIRG